VKSVERGGGRVSGGQGAQISGLLVAVDKVCLACDAVIQCGREVG